MFTITITWMDGKQETYRGDTDLRDGVLYVYKRHTVSGGVKETWSFPLANIRVWTVSR